MRTLGNSDPDAAFDFQLRSQAFPALLYFEASLAVFRADLHFYPVSAKVQTDRSKLLIAVEREELGFSDWEAVLDFNPTLGETHQSRVQVRKRFGSSRE